MPIDPGDFPEEENTDQEVPEGRVPSEGQRSGQPGVGGLTTEEAEESYLRATDEEFSNQVNDESQEEDEEQK